MKDLYLGDLIAGECYDTFDGRMIYIDQVHTNYCIVHECDRAKRDNWTWNLRTISYLRFNIRTIMEVV